MRRSSAAVAVVAILVTGCGPSSPLTLDLRGVSVDLKHVVTPAVDLVPPPAGPPPAALPPIPPVTELLPTPAPKPSLPTPVAPPADPCPEASSLDVPAVPASQLIPGPPVNATSTQTSIGSYAGAAGTPSSGSLQGEVTMTTIRMPSTTSSVGQKIDAWRVVRRGPAPGASSVEVYRLVHPSSATGATTPGLYLVGLAWKDPARGDVSFQASGTGLNILPQPSQPSQNDIQYIGADTDAATLTTLELTRNVRQHKRIDACGELIDTITVEMTGTLTTPDLQRQITWTQQLATSYGGVDVAETFALTSIDAGYSWSRSLRNTSVPKLPEERS